LLKFKKFTFRGKHYKDVFGTVIGSPVSSVVAKLVIEIVGKRALGTFALHDCGKDM